jgi:DnaJ family protein C protein 9
LERTKREYQASEEEKEDLLAAYNQYSGDMNKIYEVIMLSNPLDDEERFCAIFDKAIKDGEIEAMKKYTEEPKKKKEKRMANARREAGEAGEALKNLQEKDGTKKGGVGKKGRKKGGDEADLAALIQQRQKSRATNFFDDLETKYGGKASKKRSSEPPEEAFAEVAARASKKQKGENKSKKQAKPTKVS